MGVVLRLASQAPRTVASIIRTGVWGGDSGSCSSGVDQTTPPQRLRRQSPACWPFLPEGRRPERGPPCPPPHPPALSLRPRPRPGPRFHWFSHRPRRCLPRLPGLPLDLPGPPRKFEKKKKFYGRMEGAGAAPGKGRAGAEAAGGREGRRAGCAAEPGPRVPSSVPGRRHDGEWPQPGPGESGS